MGLKEEHVDAQSPAGARALILDSVAAINRGTPFPSWLWSSDETRCPSLCVTFPKEARSILLTLTGFRDALRKRFGHINVSSSVSALQ